MAYPERRLLGRFLHTGTLSANTHWSPTPQLVTSPALPQGYLNGQQVGEVEYLVVHSPRDPVTGAAQDLKYVQLVLDGTPYNYIYLSGRLDSLMAPDPQLMRRGKPIYFGKPIIGRNGQVASALDATCPKFVKSVSVQAIAGSSDVTADFQIDVYGYVYDSTDLATRIPVYDAGNIVIPDPLNSGRTFKVITTPIAANGDWKQGWRGLPGGPEQASGIAHPIHKLVRVATNALATVANTGYIPKYASAQNPAVANAQDNLYFDLSAAQAIIAERLGLNGPAAPNSTGYDVLSAWIATASETQHQHPDGGIAADYNQGITRFGQSRLFTGLFDGVPELPQGNQLLTDEIAYPTFVDNGTSIPANDVRLAFVGTLIGTNAEGV